MALPVGVLQESDKRHATKPKWSRSPQAFGSFYYSSEYRRLPGKQVADYSPESFSCVRL